MEGPDLKQRLILALESIEAAEERCEGTLDGLVVAFSVSGPEKHETGYAGGDMPPWARAALLRTVADAIDEAYTRDEP